MHDHQDGSECPGADYACRTDPAEDASPVIQALCRVTRLHHQLAWQLLRAAGLHPGQELIMMRLWADGPQQPAALIRLLGSDAATMTRSVQRLERAGFVRREPSPTDRRAVIIEATQASQALRAQVEAIWPRLEDLCTRGFADGERAQATELLARIERNLARAASEQGPGKEPSLRPGATGGRCPRPPASARQAGRTRAKRFACAAGAWLPRCPCRRLRICSLSP
jgi:DNA-binding MarR family transcriptional regulator